MNAYIFTPQEDIDIQTVAKVVALLFASARIAIPQELYDQMTDTEKKHFSKLEQSRIIKPKG